MSNKYPKNGAFNNIVVRNKGDGRITSDTIWTDTIYVKNLVVTDSLQLPITNIDTLDVEDVDSVVINKEVKKISKYSGSLSYNSELEDVIIKKNGISHELSANKTLGNISNVMFEKTNDVAQAINNSFNKFKSITQNIDFKGTQPPGTKNFVLGSNNNINFLLDDSSFYLFEGFIMVNIKGQVFESFGYKEFSTDKNEKIKLKRLKINYSTYIIKNGLIKMQETDVNSYEIINLSNKVTNTSFKLKKLLVGNKSYLAIETENLSKYYVSWKANIKITKINVKSTLTQNKANFDFYILKNKPLEHHFNWNCYSTESNTLFYRYRKKINFFNIPLYNLSKTDGEDVLDTLFYTGDDNNNIIDRDINSNEIVKQLDNSTNTISTLSNEDDVVIFNKDFDTFYTVLTDDVSLLVRDIQHNSDSIKPFAYKHTYYHQSSHNRSQKINYLKSKSFWTSEEFNNVKVKQSSFFTVLDIDYSGDKLINYVYLPKSLVQGVNDYFDYYLFSMNSNFIVNYVNNKIHEFKKTTFLLDSDSDKHYFIYKDIRRLSLEYTPIFLSYKTVYNFKFGTINIMEGSCVIIDSDANSSTFKKSKSIKIYADFYIPTFQNIRSDIINKLINYKLSLSELNNYLENAYLNKNFTNATYTNVNDKVSFIPTVDDNNTGVGVEDNVELFEDFDIKVTLALRKINLNNITKLNYATISKELVHIEDFYLKISVKSSLEKSYQVNVLFENNIFDIFSI